MREREQYFRLRNRGFRRFSRYAVVGGGTFAFDLVLLYVLIDHFDLEPVNAAAVAFLVAVSINYVLSRLLVFRGSERSWTHAYAGFLVIAVSGVAIVSSAMHLMVNVYSIDYLPARLIVAGITGIWNYLLNLYFNFRVAGKPL